MRGIVCSCCCELLVGIIRRSGVNLGGGTVLKKGPATTKTPPVVHETKLFAPLATTSDKCFAKHASRSSVDDDHCCVKLSCRHTK